MRYKQKINEVVDDLKGNVDCGLKSSEVEKRLIEHGYNELTQKKSQSLFSKFMNQFKDPLIVILIVAAIISVLVDPHEWIESCIIFVVVLFNAILGVMQESSAEKSLEALKQMSAPQAKVIRDNQRLTVLSRELVVGDIVLIEAGDYIVSDGRLIESHQLQIDESALTGESLPVNKMTDAIDQVDLALGDQKNMVFSSTVCTYGRGKMIVTSTGMDNEVGKIASMLMEAKQESTPLQIKLAQISKIIGVMSLSICGIVFALEVYVNKNSLEAFKTAIALAVAAIPEGLATVVTIVLAIGVTKMVKNNAIIRKLPAVETLGSASIVCSDKTGTLTQNKMTVVKTYIPELGVQDFLGSSQIRELMRYFTMCSDAELVIENDKIKLLGDPTETAFVEASYKLKDTKEELSKTMIREAEIAFDSTRKCMTVFYRVNDEIISITKGAPDILLSKSINTTAKDYEANELMASHALRVLAVGIRKWSVLPKKMDSNIIENDLTFIGLAGLIDPPREEVKEAIQVAKRGGIRTIMITGDHITTASAIAKQLGILTSEFKAMSGAELDKLSDEELADELESIAVYARVAPVHKVRIVSMWQNKGHVVAMTGDGVNDSPALKKADIGCAMGITGTDVSKGAADMVLTDDNFKTIIEAVKEGRGIYNNIKKDVQFLLSSNIGEVITIFVASLLSAIGFSIGTPLMPVHLLWVNLVTDTLPAFAIGLELVEDDIMDNPPRDKNESFFAHHLGFTILWQGIMIGILTLIAYIIGNNTNHELGMTMAFFTLSLSQLFHAFNVKSNHSIFHKTIFNNKYLWLSLSVGLGLQFMVMYVPGLNTIFELVPLNQTYLAISFGLALCPIPIVELSKLLKKQFD